MSLSSLKRIITISIIGIVKKFSKIAFFFRQLVERPLNCVKTYLIILNNVIYNDIRNM